MWSRRRIDITWRDLASAAAMFPRRRADATSAIERDFGNKSLAVLSVRSGFDLLLSRCDFAPGDEVLMSAATIADMASIVRHHNLVPVPVDLDPATMFPTVETISASITARTRAVVLAHLYGSLSDIGPTAELCRRRGLMLIEDAAQAFAGDRWRGHEHSHVVMFSFGPIKTATALGGGIMIVRDDELRRSMRQRHATYPVQPRSEYYRRLMRYAGLKFLSPRPMTRCLFAMCGLLGRDASTLINGAVRNINGEDFFGHLRRQPSAVLVAMMHRRIARYDMRALDRRAALGDQFVRALADGIDRPSGEMVPSSAASPHTWWAVPVACTDVEAAAATLRSAGFDSATHSSMQTIDAIEGRPDTNPTQAAAAIAKTLYVPLYPAMPTKEIKRMAKLLQPHISQSD